MPLFNNARNDVTPSEFQERRGVHFIFIFKNSFENLVGPTTFRSACKIFERVEIRPRPSTPAEHSYDQI